MIAIRIEREKNIYMFVEPFLGFFETANAPVVRAKMKEN